MISTDAQKIRAILECYECDMLGNFDPKFLYSLRERLEQGKDLTVRQQDALENIYTRYNIEEKLDE